MEQHDPITQATTLQLKLQQLMLLTSLLLEDLIDQQGSPCISPFNAASVPSMSLHDFIKRLHKYTKYSPECLILAIIYIDRYNMHVEDFRLNHFNAYKMVLVTVLLAAKFQDDFYYDNKAYQFAGGVNAAHLHQLELELFEKLEFDLYVSEETYEEYELQLYEHYKNQEQT